ncbi:MAG: SGNH/GDSL hydrolase family protein [Bacteroidia bacterium]|nr:SGNH/GDSL hydrolase family protein [Bacteroidia bacterium]
MKKNNILLIGLAALAIGACKPNLDPVPANAGKNLDLTKYIAVGNSLTAGYADGGLYNEAIMYSYPNFIAKQFKLVGGGEFNQPFFDESQKNGSGFLKITGWNTNGTPIIANETSNLAVVNPSTGQLARYTGPNNNYGIPGLRMIEVLSAPYAQLNPFFERLLPPLTTKSYVDFVKEANATFFTLWLGNNDVLGYAIRGGDPTGINISDGLYPLSSIGAPNTISPPTAFNAATDALINALTENGAKGAVALIPDVATIPFVRFLNQQIANTTPGGFPRVTLTAAQAAALNTLYTTDFDGPGPYVPYSNPNFVAGNNFFVISIDNPYTANVREVRQMNPQTDYFLLSAQALLSNPTTGLAAGLGVARPNDGSSGIPNPPITQLPNPIPDWAVLDSDEVLQIRSFTAQYNSKLRSAADTKGLAVVDAGAIFNQIIQNNGIDGVKLNSAFISGGLFSLDGIHLTPKGYAVVANQFIKAINAKYEAKIPLIDVNSLNLRTVVFP